MVTLNAARGILSVPDSRRDAQVSRPAFEPVAPRPAGAPPAAR